MHYIDDSGAEKTGYVVYAWIECAADAWSDAQQCWVDLRNDLYAKFAIPPAYELHSSPFLNGRGNPSRELTWNRVKRYRRQVFQQALGAIGASPHVRIGSVYRRVGSRGHTYGVDRLAVYQRLVGRLEHSLVAVDGYGLVVMDGDGSDMRYTRAHRGLELTDRRMLEDPFFRYSGHGLWIQLADLVAYTAYQHLLRTPERSFMWDWYERYLGDSDVNGGRPLEI